MGTAVAGIPLAQLILMVIPIVLVVGVYVRWALPVAGLLYAVGRMVSQLILIGYVLIVIFEQANMWITSAVLAVMLLFAGWIALRPLKHLQRRYYKFALLAIVGGGLPILVLVVGAVVRLDPWYAPRYMIPLAGMIFANAMNSVSLCAERLDYELKQGRTFVAARRDAYRTALLPLLNSFFAVGLVSIPGMMTGQILAGMSPLLAVRYQMMVMAMLLGSNGLSSALYITFVKKTEGKI